MHECMNFREWPFHITADEDNAGVWAGRKKTLKQMNDMLDGFRLIPSSSLHLFWANFGMGKTHTLYHLRYLCQQSTVLPRIIPVYAVMPMRSTGFLELYREIVQGLPIELLKKQLNILGSNCKGPVALDPMFAQSPGVVKALLAINPEDIEATIIARQWLAGHSGLASRDLARIGINYKITRPEAALKALSALTNLICYHPDAKKQNRLLIMVDEYQRVGELSARLRNESNASLHTYFNSHRGIHVILSFSFGNRDNLNYLVSPELLSRNSMQSLMIDVLSPQEATEFIRDLFGKFREIEDGRWSYPLTPEGVDVIIDAIQKEKTLTPRRLMGYFNHIILRAYQEYGEPDQHGYDAEKIRVFLNDPDLGALDQD